MYNQSRYDAALDRAEVAFARVNREQPTECEKLLNSGSKDSTFLATPDGKGLIRYDDGSRKIVLIRL